jgi:sugar phosphate isomerase/epimerase
MADNETLGFRKGPRVHLHVAYYKFKEYIPFLRERSLSVELYIGSGSIDIVDDDGLRSIKDSLDYPHTLSIHGPFMDLSPGAVDAAVAKVSLERFLKVVEMSDILRPEVIVFHAGYEKWKYGGKVDLWLTQSLKTWRAVMKRAEEFGVRVAIENIVDAEPGHLKRLADEMAHPLFGLCLDVGHREMFSDISAADWLSGMHPHVFELHLHDNFGEADDHKPIGEGRIDFAPLFARVKELGINPVYTLEAHNQPDAIRSLESLKKYL